MRFLNSLLASALALSSISAFADGWKHIYLQSRQIMEIQIDFKNVSEVNTSSGRTYASPVWINVYSGTRQALGADSRVRAVVSTHMGSFDGQVTDSQTIDLSYAGDGRFTGKAGLLLTGDGNESGGVNYYNTVAVVVDGEWQTDPFGNLNSFELNLGF